MSDQAYYAIRDLILRGKLPLGAVVSRRDLAANLGISMLPVAEAAQRLESEGLLESKPKVGTRVRVPSEQFVRDRFVIREALESQSARLFADHATWQQKQEIKLMAEQTDTLFGRLAAGDGTPSSPLPYTTIISSFTCALPNTPVAWSCGDDPAQ